MISITIIIIVFTCIISFIAFSNHKLIDDLIFYPPAISNRNQWYRFVTNGLIHADASHLIFNMLSLYIFGELTERDLLSIFGAQGKTMYIIMYLSALVVCLLPTYMNNKQNYHYRSLGASGAVSAVVFAGIFLEPTIKVGLFILPPIIPGFIFGPLYLVLSAYMSKRGGDNINHSAHFWGSVYGIVFLIVTCQFMSPFRPVAHFIDEIIGYFR